MNAPIGIIETRQQYVARTIAEVGEADKSDPFAAARAACWHRSGIWPENMRDRTVTFETRMQPVEVQLLDGSRATIQRRVLSARP